MLNWLRGPRPLSPFDISFLNDRFRDGHHVIFSYFAGALCLWILAVLAGMWLMGWAVDCGNGKDPPKENKNPYSVRKKG